MSSGHSTPSSEEESSDPGHDLPKFESLPHPEDSFTDNSQTSESSILEKVLEEYQEESLEEDSLIPNLNHHLEVTSESGPVIDLATEEEDKTPEVQSTTSKSEKSTTTPSASDMTNGYLFFRMLTG